MELLILAAALDRTAYERISANIDPKTDLSPAGAAIFAEIEKFYALDEHAKSIDRGILKSRLSRAFDNPKHQQRFCAILDSLPSDVSGINVAAELADQKKTVVLDKIRRALMAGGAADLPAAIAEYDALKQPEEVDTDVIQNPSMKDVIECTDDAHRMFIAPSTLMSHIRGALPGHHLLFFARPEAGKTAFAINLMRHPAMSGKRVLYVGNEDPMKESVIPRTFSALSGMPEGSDPKTMNDAAYKFGMGNVTFVSVYPGTPKQIDGFVIKYKPDLLIIDQIGNLAAKDDSYTLQLGRIMRDIRTLTKKRKIVTASFHQAGETAQDKLVLDLNDISWSHTDIPAATDLLVGIGYNQDYALRNMRMLTVLKNKLSGWHGYFPVSIDPKLSRILPI